MGCGASRISLKRGLTRVKPSSSPSPTVPTSQTGPPQSVEAWTKKEDQKRPDSDSRPSEKVTTVAEVEVHFASKSPDSQSTKSQPDLQTEAHPKDSTPTLTAQAIRESDDEEEKRKIQSTAPESKTSSDGTAVEETMDIQSVHSHDKEVKAVSLPETKRSGKDVEGPLTSDSTKSMGQMIGILSKLDKGSNQLKSMSATIVLMKSDSHDQEEEEVVQSESKEDDANPVSHTSLVSSKSKENGAMDKSVHTSEKTVEETTVETQVEEVQTTETKAEEVQPPVEKVAMTETTIDEVPAPVHKTEAAVEEVQATETTDGEILTSETVMEVQTDTTVEEVQRTEETTVEETHTTVEQTQDTTETKVEQVHSIETTVEETRTTVTEDPTSGTTVEDKPSETTHITVEETQTRDKTFEETHTMDTTVEEECTTDGSVEEVKPAETQSHGDSSAQPLTVAGEAEQGETKADYTTPANQEEDEKSRSSSSQSELNKSTATESSLGKTEKNQMVEKIEIDHSTGQSQASIVEAVEKSEQPQTPVAANT